MASHDEHRHQLPIVPRRKLGGCWRIGSLSSGFGMHGNDWRLWSSKSRGGDDWAHQICCAQWSYFPWYCWSLRSSCQRSSRRQGDDEFFSSLNPKLSLSLSKLWSWDLCNHVQDHWPKSDWLCRIWISYRYHDESCGIMRGIVQKNC